MGGSDWDDPEYEAKLQEARKRLHYDTAQIKAQQKAASQEQEQGVYRPFANPFPTLRIEYSDQADCLMLIFGEMVLTEAAFAELSVEFAKFHQRFSDKQIEEYNEERIIDYVGVNANPPPRPAPEYKPKSFNIPPNKRDKAPGFVYLMQDTVHTEYYKIGLSRKPKTRARQIGQVELIHTFPADNMLQAEKELHDHFFSRRMEGEWFKLNEPDTFFIHSITAFKNDCLRFWTAHKKEPTSNGAT